ncbi:MAG: UDP-N-acetylenolpyruvoylglucosamine reductase [Elusimicrobia bacterium RIFOXYA2_FULL_39_19]|nr:MAG: UDP-N-acetylenolpyruvoylglucosamine reductase [Elusimicrobia bacterium RIFOXYA2_FULL_39_19]
MIKILKNIPLKKHTSFKIGGKAKHFVKAKSNKDIIDAITWAKTNKTRYFVLGSGTNVLFSEKGYNGLIVKIFRQKIGKTNDGYIYCSAGTEMKRAVNFFSKNSFAGIEWAGGLPGTAGGAVRGNAGAFLGEIKDSVAKVESLNCMKTPPVLVTRTNKECKFAYRDSIFKHNDEIITAVWFKAEKGKKNKITEKIKSCKAYRNKYQPLEYPSAGSFFKNIPLKSVSAAVKKEFSSVIKNDPFPLIPAAAVTDRLGLKGKLYKGAQISPKHPNFLINKKNASFKSVLLLANLIKSKALQKFRIKMIPEVQIIK